MSWTAVAATQPAAPDSPADPAYDFSALDRAVTSAAPRGLRVLISFYDAPDYAQAGREPPRLSGAWKPKPRALGAFARAVASRYSGEFAGLPRVSHYDVWNEPNLDVFLAPQYEKGRQVSVERYRDMVKAVGRSVNGVHPGNKVVVGSLAPYGDPPGSDRTRPVTFLRRLFCLDGQLERRCRAKTHLDVLGHHPINQSGPPRQKALNPNDAASADLSRIRRVLRAAEREGTIAGDKRHPLWVTEFWWSNELADGTRVSRQKQARWTAESLYLFWRAGAKVAIYLPLVDAPTFVAGLFRLNGEPKPAATAFAFPFVTDPRGKKLVAWGKAPASGELRIERKRQGTWQGIASFPVQEGKVFQRKLSLSGPAKLRATVGPHQSLVWNQR